jgi:transposase
MTQRTVPAPTIPTMTSVQLPTTVGLDVSDQISHFHVLRGDGWTLDKGKVANTRDDLAVLFERWKGCRLVIEAGGHSPWMSRWAKTCGMEVVVANPRRVEAISKSNTKSDRTDAHMLAEIGRTSLELLAPIQHRSEQAQSDLCVLRARDELVRSRTGMINHVRGVLKSNGHRVPSCSAESFGKKASTEIPRELELGLRPVLQMIVSLTATIAGLDKQIERLCSERYPITQVLRQIGGVGPVVALTFVLTLDDPARFRRAREVGPYLGLVPRTKSSGDSNPQLRITKAGDRSMRRLLVIAANFILGRYGPDCDLRRFGLKMIGAGNDKRAKKRARVAVARKLAVLMHHLWRSGEVYDPLHRAKARGELAAA